MINPRLRGGGKRKRRMLASAEELIRVYRKRLRKKGEEGKFQTPVTTFDILVCPDECSSLIVLGENGRQLTGGRYIPKDENVPVDIRHLMKILLARMYIKDEYRLKKWKTTHKYSIEQDYYDGFEIYDDGSMCTIAVVVKSGTNSADIFRNKPEPNFDNNEKGIHKKLTYMAAKDNIKGKSWYRKYKTDAWIDGETIRFISTLVRKYDEEKWTFLMDGEKVEAIDGKLQFKVKENFEFNDIHKLQIFKSAESEIEPR
jgi:hypothetical protein